MRKLSQLQESNNPGKSDECWIQEEYATIEAN